MEQANNKNIDVLSLFKAVWHKRRLIIRNGIIGAAVGVVIALSMPREYQSSVMLVSEGNSKDKSLSGSLGVLAGIAGIPSMGSDGQGLTPAMYPDVVASIPFISEFANIKVCDKNGNGDYLHKYLSNNKKTWWSHIIRFPRKAIGWFGGLFSSDEFQSTSSNDGKLYIDRTKPSYEQRGFFETFSSRVFLDYDKKTQFIHISITMQDPYVAFQIADSVVLKLQEYITRYNTTRSRAELEMNQKLYDDAKAKYMDAESEYAEIYDRNQNLITKTAVIRLDQLRNERDVSLAVYTQLAQKLEAAKLKVKEDASIASVIEPARVAMTPISPKKVSLVIIFAILTMFITIVIIVFRNQINSAKDHKDEQATENC